MAADRDQTLPYFPSVDGTSGSPTIEIPHPSTPVPPSAPSRIALVAGRGRRLSTVTCELRQGRLRAAAWFLLAMQVVFLAWRLLFGGGGALWPLNVAMIAGLGAATASLYERWPLAERKLRMIEAAIFGQMVVYLAVRQYSMMVHGRPGSPELIVTGRGSVIAAILLMFVYAMLVPNTWRGAARVVLAFAFVPIATTMVVFAVHPEVQRALRVGISPETMSENVAFMAVACALAIYGTHVINSLRAEAFEATQLNQYRLVAPLGSGGMGDVFLAEHHLMKRPCALKRIRHDRANDPVTLARFEREVQATARLSHPNTIEIYDFGRADDGSFYYVMEYLPGLSLQEVVDRHGPMPPGRAVHLLRQACGALAEAHASGLIHRDLKPANIFAARRGGRYDVAKVLDFGLVKDADADTGDSRVTREHTIQGTPSYMAPEQVLGLPHADHRLDLYALGCVAYTLLTGRPPFEDASRIAVMAAHARTPVDPPSTYRPGLPADLEAVVLRCLSKSPLDRHPDALALERDLAACASTTEWDDRAAERWWREAEPDHLLAPAIPPPLLVETAPAPVA